MHGIRRLSSTLLLHLTLSKSIRSTTTTITDKMTLADKWKQFTAEPRAQKAGTMYKKAETGLWRALEPIGKGANKLAGRAGAEAFWPTELAEGELEKAARILRTFTQDGVQSDAAADETVSTGADVTSTTQPPASSTPATDKYASRKTQKVLRKIPQKALADASGIAIMTMFRTGFVISGASGSGVVMARLPDGSWSAPSGILIHTLGYGFLIGLDVYDVVLILRKPAALKAFERPKISLGGEFSISAGPIGNGAQVDSGVEASPCWSYTKSKGAYAGVQLDGTLVLKRDDANARFYGQQTTVSDILSGKTTAATPAAVNAVRPLWQTLYAAEGRPDVMGTDKIPQGLAPGDIGISAEEAEEAGDGAGTAGEGSSAQTSTAATVPTTKHFVPPALDAQPLQPMQSDVAPHSLAASAPAEDASQTSTANVFDDSHAVSSASHSIAALQAPTGESEAKNAAAGAPPAYT